ncbi:MAG: glycoside hydrolase family 31 protein [Candidatus Faecousia sp.]|nr:glycoside hydrolase family 31 protein [Candidatus Faecousia sp.]
MFAEKDGKLFYRYDNETVCVEAWGRNALRVRSTYNATFTAHDWALTEAVEHGDAKVTIFKDEAVGLGGFANMYAGKDDSYASITNGDITATFNVHGVLTFTNAQGKVLLKENWRRLKDEPSMSLNYYGREFKSINGDNWRLVCRFLPNDHEKIFGMGQYQQKYLDQKGCTLELSHRNSQASVPFYISNIGYGFLWNNPAIGKVSFSKNGTEWIADSTKQADYWIVAGDDPKELEETYTAVTGRAPMMPDYGMGFWQCKLRYRSQEELLAVARKHKELGLPMDVIVADFFHWTQQGEYKFDPAYWPDVAGMCKELKDMGIELMVSIWPTVDYRSENFNEMMEKGFLVRTERGARITMQCFGQEVFMDPTNPGTREFVWDKCKKNYWDNGVRLFWLDEAEPEYTVYDYDNYRYYLGTDLEVGNTYPVYYAKTFYEGMKASGMENPMNLLRCAWAGSAKYGALVWSGDIDSTFECLQRQVRAGLNMAVAGIPWWTTDIGGFHGADIHDPKFHELLMRWFAYGCFCPVFRLHGNRQPMYGFEGDFVSGIGQFGSGAENEVWSYGEDCFQIMKKYLFLRERLRPYIKDQMELIHTKGTPIMRPLFFDFREDSASWDVDDQYMFGPDIMVCPVMDAGVESRSVYLPAGASWTDAWTGKVYEGGQTIEAAAPIDVIPLFLKDGAKLPITE